MAEQKSSVWVWLSLVVIIGLFVGFIFFLDQQIVNNGRQARTVDEAPQQEIESPKFDFYEVLPDRKVDIPEPEVVVPNPTSDKPASQQAKLYLLQVGSFKAYEDADRQKAQLAMLGLEPKINKAVVDGSTYHRVVMGPYPDGGALSSAERTLIQHDFRFIRKSAK